MSNASDESSESINTKSTAVESTNADTSEPRSLTTLTVKASKSTHESTNCSLGKSIKAAGLKS